MVYLSALSFVLMALRWIKNSIYHGCSAYTKFELVCHFVMEL